MLFMNEIWGSLIRRDVWILMVKFLSTLIMVIFLLFDMSLILRLMRWNSWHRLNYSIMLIWLILKLVFNYICVEMLLLDIHIIDIELRRSWLFNNSQLSLILIFVFLTLLLVFLIIFTFIFKSLRTFFDLLLYSLSVFLSLLPDFLFFYSTLLLFSLLSLTLTILFDLLLLSLLLLLLGHLFFRVKFLLFSLIIFTWIIASSVIELWWRLYSEIIAILRCVRSFIFKCLFILRIRYRSFYFARR